MAELRQALSASVLAVVIQHQFLLWSSSSPFAFASSTAFWISVTTILDIERFSIWQSCSKSLFSSGVMMTGIRGFLLGMDFDRCSKAIVSFLNNYTAKVAQ